MEIPYSSLLKQQADRALARGRDPKDLITFYLILTTLIAALSTAASYLLGLRISDTGGLSQMGTRAIFSTAQSLLPIVQSVLLSCLQLGYLQGMLRISRGLYADRTDLKSGIRKFFPLLRLSVLLVLIYFAVGFASFFFSMQLFSLTPWYDELYTVMMPVMSSANALDPTYVMDDQTLAQAVKAMIPMLLIFAVLYGALALVLSYRFRMANYALLDDPAGSAVNALRTSTKLMRRNGLRLFKLDLSFWLYYVLSLLCSLLCYGDMLLPVLGVALPVSDTVAYFLFYGLYLAAVFALNYFFRNRLEATYMLAYDAVREKPKDEGVVLGNIFDLQ